MGNPKHIALYDESEEQRWKEAEQAVREEHEAEKVREGTVLAEICAAYIGYDGPLQERDD